MRVSLLIFIHISLVHCTETQRSVGNKVGSLRIWIQLFSNGWNAAWFFIILSLQIAPRYGTVENIPALGP
jgi:succinate dehydrogenase hydrophobic anchor subunit